MLDGNRLEPTAITFYTIDDECDYFNCLDSGAGGIWSQTDKFRDLMLGREFSRSPESMAQASEQSGYFHLELDHWRRTQQ